MTSLLSPAELQEFASSDLNDAALQIIIDGCEAEMIQRFGPHATATQTFFSPCAYIVLSRTATGIDTITADGTELTTDDFTVISGRIVRLESGSWSGPLVVTYLPEDETAKRKLALMKLCKLEIAYSGYQSQSIGDVSEQPLDLNAERERIFASLASARVVFA
jgi:hypothetical protein